MLPKPYRLTRAQDFRRVHTQGQSWSNYRMVMGRAPNQLEHSRFGFSVSRRIGNAVVRNRCKRLLREAVRVHLDETQPGWDVVFIVRRGMLHASFASIEKSVAELLRLAGMLRGV